MLRAQELCACRCAPCWRCLVCAHSLFLLQPFPLLCVVSPLLRFVMDASGVAALAVAVDHLHAAALSELLLERERLAMHAEDLRCRVAPQGGTRTWQSHFREEARENAQLRRAAAAALRDLRQGDAEMAEQRLADVVEGVDSDDSADSDD